MIPLSSSSQPGSSLPPSGLPPACPSALVLLLMMMSMAVTHSLIFQPSSACLVLCLSACLLLVPQVCSSLSSAGWQVHHASSSSSPGWREADLVATPLPVVVLLSSPDGACSLDSTALALGRRLVSAGQQHRPREGGREGPPMASVCPS